jgi:pimeloyl-ACP methyl ester carboxylesterase
MTTMNTSTRETTATSFGQQTPLHGHFIDGERTDTPLLVYLHGAGYDSRYFDAPNCSTIEQAGKAGYPIVTLNRPGYPTDPDLAASHPDFSGAADIICAALDDIWNRLGNGRPGVVLITHSIGSAIGIHIASREVSFPLLGLALSGIGDTLNQANAEILRQIPPGIAASVPFEVIRPILYGPDWTIDPSMIEMLGDLIITAPTNEFAEITTSWPEQLARQAPLVTVPVHYVLAEFDGWWPASDEAVDRVARLFTASPFVDASMWRGTGHNIEHHTLGKAYIDTVLAFAERCVAERRRPAPAV